MCLMLSTVVALHRAVRARRSNASMQRLNLSSQRVVPRFELQPISCPLASSRPSHCPPLSSSYTSNALYPHSALADTQHEDEAEKKTNEEKATLVTARGREVVEEAEVAVDPA